MAEDIVKESPFSKPTPEEVRAQEAEKKRIDESISEARKAAQDCLNSDLFKEYQKKYLAMEGFLVAEMKRVDRDQPGAATRIFNLLATMEVLGALLASVKIDAGAN